jgi:ribosomal-protein-alanine N-acetyltransferase
MSLNDIIKVDQINRSTLPENYDLGFYLRLMFTEPLQQFVVVDETDQIVGYALLASVQSLTAFDSYDKQYENDVVLLSLSVVPEYRQKNIGHLLMKKIVSTFKSVILQVRISNNIAIHLYKKYNFQIQQTISKYYQDGEDAYLMKFSI